MLRCRGRSSFLSCALCLRTFFRQCDLSTSAPSQAVKQAHIVAAQHLARHPQLPSAAPGPVPVLPPPLAAAIPRAVELVVPPAAPAQPPLVGNGVGQPAAACGICLGASSAPASKNCAQVRQTSTPSSSRCIFCPAAVGAVSFAVNAPLTGAQTLVVAVRSSGRTWTLLTPVASLLLDGAPSQ
jgi:hypothetical protein